MSVTRNATPKTKSWRDVYPVHPAADALPMLTAEALARCRDNDLFDTLWALVEAALTYDHDGTDRYEWAERIVKSWKSTAAVRAGSESES